MSTWEHFPYLQGEEFLVGELMPNTLPHLTCHQGFIKCFWKSTARDCAHLISHLADFVSLGCHLGCVVVAKELQKKIQQIFDISKETKVYIGKDVLIWGRNSIKAKQETPSSFGNNNNCRTKAIQTKMLFPLHEFYIPDREM